VLLVLLLLLSHWSLAGDGSAADLARVAAAWAHLLPADLLQRYAAAAGCLNWNE
jgi:NADPH:quinone reductase-like Zn-dependent oxidoreductase